MYDEEGGIQLRKQMKLEHKADEKWAKLRTVTGITTASALTSAGRKISYGNIVESNRI